nr:MAG: hypothetical protein DIU61_01165 [Bacteroidota bacterium]
MVCNSYLLNEGFPYFIEKSVRQFPELGTSEIIFEYALCFSCSASFNAALSETSRQRMAEYFARYGRFEARREKLHDAPVDEWVAQCLIKDTPIAAAPEYQIVAQCAGKKLVVNDLPFAISLEAMDEIAALLSEETLGEMDDFMGKYFTGPPELAELLSKRPPVLL